MCWLVICAITPHISLQISIDLGLNIWVRARVWLRARVRLAIEAAAKVSGVNGCIWVCYDHVWNVTVLRC